MKRIILYPHGGSGNHGCEAIVRTTVKILEGNEIFLFSERPDEDRKYLNDLPIKILSPHKEIHRNSFSFARAKYRQLVHHQKNALDIESFSPILDVCDKESILLSIGGDNYCYGVNEHLLLINREARKKGTKTVLWGASVDENLISREMEEDLKEYDLIIAREPLSYEYLKRINTNSKMLPDPAFYLEKKNGNYPKDLFDKKVIGINISPMIIGRETKGNITINNYKLLIKRILEETEDHIALIRVPMKELYETYKNTGRVFTIEDQSCTQLKDIISKCSFFIGARTHSTIAAYSSGVPTIVMGYSIKALGIAQELFGSAEGYVIPVQQLSAEDNLYQLFQTINKQADKIQQMLKSKNDEYRLFYEDYLNLVKEL